MSASESKERPATQPNSSSTSMAAPAAGVAGFFGLTVDWRREFRWVVLLAVVGGVRVLFGAQALPFFADTDEDGHFDLVHKFARGEWPGGGPAAFDDETITRWALDGSPEFINPLERFPRRRVPPPTRNWPNGPERDNRVRQVRAYLETVPNHEAHEPPVYYAVAAVWYRVGQLLRLSPPATVYWVRFLNALVYAGLVAAAYLFARPAFGADVAFAAATLTAVFPNPVFFTISSDVLSPLAGAVALVLLFRWYEAERPSRWLAIGVGPAVAAAVLTKLSNVALLAAVGVAVLLRFRRDRQWGKVIVDAGLLAAAASVPVLLWGWRNRRVLGDWTGTAAKEALLTWKPKPAGEWLDHPLFTADGLFTFLTTLCNSLFGGDSGWHASPVHSPMAEYFFYAVAAVLPVAGLIAALVRGSREPQRRFVAGVSALVIAV